MGVFKTIKSMIDAHDETEKHLNAIDHVERGGAVKVKPSKK